MHGLLQWSFVGPRQHAITEYGLYEVKIGPCYMRAWYDTPGPNNHNIPYDDCYGVLCMELAQLFCERHYAARLKTGVLKWLSASRFRFVDTPIGRFTIEELEKGNAWVLGTPEEKTRRFFRECDEAERCAIQCYHRLIDERVEVFVKAHHLHDPTVNRDFTLFPATDMPWQRK